MERLLPLDRRFLQPAPKGLGDPKGEVELVPDAWTVFEQIAPIYMPRHDLWCHDRELLRRAERPHDRHGFRHQERQGHDPGPGAGVQPHPSGLHHQEITEIIGGAAAVQVRQNNEKPCWIVSPDGEDREDTMPHNKI